MLKNFQLHISRIFFISLLLFCLLQLFSVNANAQYDTVFNDFSISDTVIEEIDNPPPPPEDDEYADNDEKDFFKEKYLHDTLSILQRNIPDSVKKAMQKDDAFWYANAEIEKAKEEKTNNKKYTPLGQQTWVRTLFWMIIIGVFAAVIMWFLAESNIGLFRKKNKLVKAEEEEFATEDIFAINYQKEIDKAAGQANYRLAVRLMFLRLLKNMSEKNVINYKQDKTNFDYLLQLHSTNYYKDFFRITRNYEYTWYGQFEINEEAYKIIRNDFDLFEKNLARS